MREVTTVYDPCVGDKLRCPGCEDMLTLTPMDGWGGPHVGCVDGTVHHDWIISVFSDPNADNPRYRAAGTPQWGGWVSCERDDLTERGGIETARED